ncbi:MAG: hypothetical protein N2Z59_04775 [Alteraurantiacibacter sp.]|nr:hypothetical protein [Alteraurantiacibacter sp.]
MKETRFFAAALVAAMLGACASTGTPVETAHYYECGTFLLRVNNPGSETITLRRDGNLVGELRLVPSDTGRRYEGHGHAIHIVGQQATYTGPTREAPYVCRRVDQLR